MQRAGSDLQASLWDENGAALPGAVKKGTFTVKGAATAQAPLTLSAWSLTFEDIKVGATSRKALILTNAGSASLTVSNIAISGTDAAQFKVTPTRVTLAARRSQNLTVTFAPTSAGAKSASLSITYSGAGSPATVSLSGKGIAASGPILSATALTFDDTKVGATSRTTLTVTNPGTGLGVITGITVGGADAAQFGVAPRQFTVSAKSTKVVTVTFAPTSAGAKSASLSIAHNGIGGPVTVTLSGQGIAVKPEGLQVSVGTGSGTPGSTVTVPISVNSAQGIAGGDVSLSYDAQVLRAKEVKVGELLSSAGITAIPNLGTAGQVKVAMAGAAGIASGNGALLQVAFEVLAGAAPGTYELGLEAMLWDENGMALPAAVEKGIITVKATAGRPAVQAQEGPPLAPGLLPNYPNPFNSATVISYQVANAEHVQLAVYNLLGQQARMLVDQVQGPGSHQVVWDGRDEQGQEVTSGIYLCGFQAGSFRAVRRLALVQ